MQLYYNIFYCICAPGEAITDENEEGEEKCESGSTKYQLIGVVVHSGQASGGHYYSYILHRSVSNPFFISCYCYLVNLFVF